MARIIQDGAYLLLFTYSLCADIFAACFCLMMRAGWLLLLSLDFAAPDERARPPQGTDRLSCCWRPDLEKVGFADGACDVFTGAPFGCSSGSTGFQIGCGERSALLAGLC
uniref:Uncharacterized protein n=1 Tax=Hemiselmis andersenii TaxID=464988 RepID=A0A7S0U9S6_HEMAN